MRPGYQGGPRHSRGQSRPHVIFLAAILAVRAVQLARILGNSARPFGALNMGGVTPAEIAGLLAAPLFLFLLHRRLGDVYRPSMLVRYESLQAARAAYLRGCAVDSLFAAAAIQLSGLVAALLSGVAPRPEELFSYLVPATGLLMLHYLLASGIFLLSSMNIGSTVISLAPATLFLCWDLGAQYVVFLIQNDAYTGVLLIDGLLGGYAPLYYPSALRVAAFALVVVGLLLWSIERSPAETIVERFAADGKPAN